MLKLTRATPVHVGFKLFPLLWHTSIIKPDIKIFIALRGRCKIQVFFNFYLKFQNFAPYPMYLHPLRIKLKDFGNKIIFPFSRFFPLKLSHRSLGKIFEVKQKCSQFSTFLYYISSFHMKKILKVHDYLW